MVQTVYSTASTGMKRIAIPSLLSAGLLFLASGCGSASGESASGRLAPSDVRQALRSLPYEISLTRIKGPSGNTASFRGKARGPRDIILKFSIGIGDPPKAIPVKPLGVQNSAHEDASGFVYNDDAWPSEFGSLAQWKVAAHMSVDVWESLCKAATGEPCPV